MQFQADLLGLPVEVAAERETTALGAAALAAGREVRVAVGDGLRAEIGSTRPTSCAALRAGLAASATDRET